MNEIADCLIKEVIQFVLATISNYKRMLRMLQDQRI